MFLLCMIHHIYEVIPKARSPTALKSLSSRLGMQELCTRETTRMEIRDIIPVERSATQMIQTHTNLFRRSLIGSLRVGQKSEDLDLMR